MRMKMNVVIELFLTLLCVLGTTLATADIGRFPVDGDWSKGAFSWHLEGGSVGGAVGRSDFVDIAKTAEDCRFDVRKAFEAGAERVVLQFPEFAKPVLDSVRGKRMVIEIDAKGTSGDQIDILYVGNAGSGGKERHYWGHGMVTFSGRRRTYRLIREIAADVIRLGVRLDLVRQCGESIRIHAIRWGTPEELGVLTRLPQHKPQLLMREGFDGRQDGVSGLQGAGLRTGGRDGRRLVLPLPRGFDRAHGMIAFWMKHGEAPWSADLLELEIPKGTERVGTGAWKLRHEGEFFKLSRFDDNQKVSNRHQSDLRPGWTHVAVAWNETTQFLFVNGVGGDEYGTRAPIRKALAIPEILSFSGPKPASLVVGSNGGDGVAQLVIDDLRIYSSPLSAAQVWELYKASAPSVPDARGDYARRWKSESPNPYVKESGDLDLELVESVTLDRAGVERLEKANRFRAVGRIGYGEADGTPYVQSSEGYGSRFVVGFDLNVSHPLHLVEISYPDDAERTVDVVVHTRDGNWFDSTLQVGYSTGAENVRTGKTVSYRALYWTDRSNGKIGVSFMNLNRGGAGAAASSIRVYRVKDGKLPVLNVSLPDGVPGRWFCVNYEDPAIGCDFSVQSVGRGAYQKDMMDRMIALMRYTGQDRFTYPRVWYEGFNGFCEDGLGYNVRGWHPEGWFDLWYERFDREGLAFVPSMHPRDMPFDTSALSHAALSDGSLHPLPVAVCDDGLVHSGFAYNPAHPETRAYVEKIIDQVAADAERHPSVKGVETRICGQTVFCFSSPSVGYNDYAVEAFARDCGIRIPASIDRKAPLRGRQYAEWLRRDHWERWLDWRCSVVTDNYRRYVARLRSHRPDLVLVLNMQSPAQPTAKGFCEPGFYPRYLRGMGLDPEGLGKIDGLVLSAGLVPSDVRWFNAGPKERQTLREVEYKTETYALVAHAKCPALCQHDRYFESPIGRDSKPNTPGSLSCSWYREHPWRVVTVNPSGDNQLRHFALPLKFNDLLGLAKGGYLIGTYGMEERLRPFMAAWRSLPAVKFDDLASPDPDVVVRGKSVAGREYKYVVNCSVVPRCVKISDIGGMKDLVSHEVMRGEIALPAWGLRAFAR